MLVSILLGSSSDQKHADKITAELDLFDVPHEVKALSAHKVPELCLKHIDHTNTLDNVVYITCAGRSNGLSGVISGSSIHPVIACPPFSDKSDYLANIHSSVLMPSDTPSMTVVDPQNAALAAVKILAVGNPELLNKVRARITEVKQKFV